MAQIISYIGTGGTQVIKFPKWHTWRSEPYKIFVRGHACLICQTPLNVQAHHESLTMGAMGSKAPDSHCVPLCLGCHAYRHSSEWGGWDNAALTIELVIIELLTEYIQGKK